MAWKRDQNPIHTHLITYTNKHGLEIRDYETNAEAAAKRARFVLQTGYATSSVTITDQSAAAPYPSIVMIKESV